MDNLEKGQVWFVSLGTDYLSKIELIDVTEKTVTFKSRQYSSNSSTRTRKSISFIEQTKW